ncbi:MAG TPA: phosphodiester glycosidase family protein [Fimbriimonadaceae bacterium]|nr:phosphodiester glycosidase family protein [Fimbriimonadaceae bacterium]
MSLLAATLSIQLAVAPYTRPVAHSSFRHGKGYYHVVQADVRSVNVSPKMVHSPQLTSVWTMIGKSQPLVAITGTFFSPKYHNPVADVLVNGELVAKGARGSVVGITHAGNIDIFDSPYLHTVDWKGYQFGMRGAVRVVNAGKVVPNPQAQAFKDKAIWGRAARTGIGLTKSGKLVLIATEDKVTLSELGRAMKARGVRSGVSLDGGSSTCLYYKGKLVISPKRKLSNLLVITVRPNL